MQPDRDVEHYLDIMEQERLFSSRERLRFKVEALFDGVDFRGRRVLDIGGGRGLYSFYAAARGAREVVCLEPESEGSSSGITATFERLRRALGRENVVLERATLQEYRPAGGGFDVILLHNSVNHLDEPACMRLLEDEQARAAYREIFARLARLANPGARLVICDCSRYNFFAALGVRNPFAPKITWEKHQGPETWAELLRGSGFANPDIRWSTFNRLGRVGRALLARRWISYFLTSHFRLTMEKPA